MTDSRNDTHSLLLGYLLWLFGFFGIHRFYYGKPVSGTIWFFTLGLLGVGWLVDFFLIPKMDRTADWRFHTGPYDYNVAWLLLVLFGLGALGAHRFYMGKWITGLIYLCTGGLFVIGILYDLWTLNDQVDELNLTEAYVAEYMRGARAA
jgi:TM2 domain-containing membrane protein YozV